MRTSIQVLEYYQDVQKKHGTAVATKFRELMKEWNKGEDALDFFYERQVQDMILEDALEQETLIIDEHYGIHTTS